MRTVYIYYVYIKTHIDCIYFENISMSIFIYSYNLYYKYLILNNVFLKYTCICVYLYIHSTHILCKQTFILDAINRD